MKHTMLLNVTAFFSLTILVLIYQIRKMTHMIDDLSTRALAFQYENGGFLMEIDALKKEIQDLKRQLGDLK